MPDGSFPGHDRQRHHASQDGRSGQQGPASDPEAPPTGSYVNSSSSRLCFTSISARSTASIAASVAASVRWLRCAEACSRSCCSADRSTNSRLPCRVISTGSRRTSCRNRPKLRWNRRASSTPATAGDWAVYPSVPEQGLTAWTALRRSNGAFVTPKRCRKRRVFRPGCRSCPITTMRRGP